MDVAESESTIAERVRKRRAALGLSLNDVSSRGVSRTYVSLIEKGQRQPSMKALRALAPALHVSVHWLETGQDDPALDLARHVLAATARPTPQMRRLAQTILENSPGRLPVDNRRRRGQAA